MSDVICEQCGAQDAKRRRQNTQYCDDDRNYATLCPDCQLENDRYWADMWADYYANCL